MKFWGKRTWFLTAVLLVSLVLLAACGGEEPSETSSQAASSSEGALSETSSQTASSSEKELYLSFWERDSDIYFSPEEAAAIVCDLYALIGTEETAVHAAYTDAVQGGFPDPKVVTDYFSEGEIVTDYFVLRYRTTDGVLYAYSVFMNVGEEHVASVLERANQINGVYAYVNETIEFQPY